jgi:hypothetical protein
MTVHTTVQGGDVQEAEQRVREQEVGLEQALRVANDAGTAAVCAAILLGFARLELATMRSARTVANSQR